MVDDRSPRYRFDPETLRDVPLDPAALTAWLDGRLRAPVPADPAAERRHRTETGLVARMLYRLDVAESELRRALELAVAHGTAEHATNARVRYAHLLQWQGRVDEALALFDECLRDGFSAHFVHQHAGKCCYDFALYDRAAGHFGEALRLRTPLGDRSLTESTELAVAATGACVFAAAVAVELDRLVPGVHAALRPHAAPVVAPAQPHAAILIDARNLLLAGPVPLPVLRAVHRYHGDRVDAALRGLAGRGWLRLDGDAVTATPDCRALLTGVMAVMDEVLTRLWGAPAEPTATLEALVAHGRGTSGGVLFDALVAAGHPGQGTVAGRLFTALCAARYHRADAHAGAWSSEGCTAESVRALDPAEPRRRRIEAITNQRAARLYRGSDGRLLAALRTLPV